MTPVFATFGLFPTSWGRIILMIHLLVSVFALGAVTHHGWTVVSRKNTVNLGSYAKWTALSYTLSWIIGVIIYPSYNVLIRKAPIGVLESLSPRAVGFFEIKEHFGSFALIMLPWLLLSARHFDTLTSLERRSYVAATWVFTVFVYFTFVTGGFVTAVKSF